MSMTGAPWFTAWHGKGVTVTVSYADFTIRNYGKATVIFDGYSEDPSIKDNTHQRHGANIQVIVKFNAETEFVGRKEDFLSRSSKKKRSDQSYDHGAGEDGLHYYQCIR